MPREEWLAERQTGEYFTSSGSVAPLPLQCARGGAPLEKTPLHHANGDNLLLKHISHDISLHSTHKNLSMLAIWRRNLHIFRSPVVNMLKQGTRCSNHAYYSNHFYIAFATLFAMMIGQYRLRSRWLQPKQKQDGGQAFQSCFSHFRWHNILTQSS